MTYAGFLLRANLQGLFDLLLGDGYQLAGPTARDGAIQFRPISAASDLPQGLRDEQAPGSYRLIETDSPRQFAWTVGPQALKPMFFSPKETLWSSARADDEGLVFTPSRPERTRKAVIGARACDLAALAMHDRHFADDPYYQARRADLFIIAVDCARSADTCFCVSTGDGPSATAGFDMALTELDDGFLLRADSDAGQAVLAKLALSTPSGAQLSAAASQHAEASRQQRNLPGTDLRTALFDKLDHPHWQNIAQRCLACGNCTAVCPTCFCHSKADEVALDGARSAHIREWDSCFNQGHAYLHGYPVRRSTDQYYRQWLTHKLGSWHDQFGRSGCVGCGRCISWCPVGIDLTQEAHALCDEGRGG